ncbi:hypothetical protein [Thiothrix nivea]|uniref:hypothetical protein n=1 Tax=Thiothrix nivea TaxID=1031 RepID=UPI0005925999|nr:hypothetical protein [Thiothrix nivea]
MPQSDALIFEVSHSIQHIRAAELPQNAHRGRIHGRMAGTLHPYGKRPGRTGTGNSPASSFSPTRNTRMVLPVK